MKPWTTLCLVLFAAVLGARADDAAERFFTEKVKPLLDSQMRQLPWPGKAERQLAPGLS